MFRAMNIAKNNESLVVILANCRLHCPPIASCRND